MKSDKKSDNKSKKDNKNTAKGKDKYAPQTPDVNRPDLGVPTPNPTTSTNINMS